MNKLKLKGATLAEVIAALEAAGVGYTVDRSFGYAIVSIGPADQYGCRNFFKSLKFSADDVFVGKC